MEAANELKILNALTRRKDPLKPNKKRSIKWYSCGPTVYDVAHLGHARCYITFDIIRRILSDYFGYKVKYVMNITDIDDKIIKRARSNHLCDKFIENFIDNFDVKKKTEYVLQLRGFVDNYKMRHVDGEKDPAKLEMFNNVLSASQKAISELESIATTGEANSRQQLSPLLHNLRDVIADEQDVLLAHTISDPLIFKSLTERFEKEFFDDMERLDVGLPSKLTRVSEYIDEIGAYIKRIESNGFAYRTGGSIYFDTMKFDSDPKHSYAKLVREAFNQSRDLNEGEGELSQSHQDKKKSPNDFALWKKSKPGEPSWQTEDFEAGRPGWHIECSAMASHVLGESLDIHSGGCDLKFPHHDNEIAQAEAYYNTGKNWVNHFVHSGHLTISGCKMSKSLKNFVTIRQALHDYTSRQLRFAFLAHGWTETLDYSPNTMNIALTYERTFRQLLWYVFAVLRRCSTDLAEKPSKADCEIETEYDNSLDQVHEALCDNFDTRTVLNILRALVKECNKRKEVSVSLLESVASYIKQILSAFGVSYDEIENSESLYKYAEVLAEFRSEVRKLTKSGDAQQGFKQISSLSDTLVNQTLPKIGVHLDAKSSAPDDIIPSARLADSTEESETALHVVNALLKFRSDVLGISKSGDTQQSVKQIMGLCDELRDQTLPDLGVRLEDLQADRIPYVIELVDSKTLAQERAEEERVRQEKKLEKETRRLQLQEQQQRKREEQKKKKEKNQQK